jgi:hypothetical protein
MTCAVALYLVGGQLTAFAIVLLHDVENDPPWMVLWAIVWPAFVAVALAVAFRRMLR